MVINITNDVRLRTDDHNYTLEARTVTRAHHRTKAENLGKSRWVTHGHYGTLRAACRGLIDRHAKHLLGDAEEEECVRSMQQIIDRIDALEAKIVGVFDEQSMVLQEHKSLHMCTTAKVERSDAALADVQLTPDDLRHLRTGGLIQVSDKEGSEYIELAKPAPEVTTIAGGRS